MQNDFVNLVDSLYGEMPPIVMQGTPITNSITSSVPLSPIKVNSSVDTVKYVVLGIIFLAFVYIVIKALKSNNNNHNNHIVQQEVVKQKIVEEVPVIASPWTTPWTPEPEEFTVTGPLPYSDPEEKSQFSKISADGNDTNLENYIKQREDFSKT